MEEVSLKKVEIALVSYFKMKESMKEQRKVLSAYAKSLGLNENMAKDPENAYEWLHGYLKGSLKARVI